MPAIKVKLVASLEGRNPAQRGTIAGLGLRKLGQERILKDTPAVRGMVKKVAHMVELSEAKGEAPKRTRTKRPKAQAENK